MTLLHIVKLGHPVLREKAAPVAAMTPELERLADDMAETMYAAPGIGLAAPQVGVALRLFVCDPDYREDRASRRPRVFVNPEVLEESPEDEKEEEGCLSIPGVLGDVWRPAWIRVRARDRRFREFETVARGLFARVILHELDHLDGVVFPDRMAPARRAELIVGLDRVRERARGEEPLLAALGGAPWTEDAFTRAAAPGAAAPTASA